MSIFCCFHCFNKHNFSSRGHCICNGCYWMPILCGMLINIFVITLSFYVVGNVMQHPNTIIKHFLYYICFQIKLYLHVPQKMLTIAPILFICFGVFFSVCAIGEIYMDFHNQLLQAM